MLPSSNQNIKRSVDFVETSQGKFFSVVQSIKCQEAKQRLNRTKSTTKTKNEEFCRDSDFSCRMGLRSEQWGHPNRHVAWNG